MITKTTMVVIFNLQNSHSLTFSFPTEEVFQVNGENRPVANLPVVDFHSQPREMLTVPEVVNTILTFFTHTFLHCFPLRIVLFNKTKKNFFSMFTQPPQYMWVGEGVGESL